MYLRTIIQELGYTLHETAVYLATLELGSGTETEIAEKAKLPRTTVNSVLEALHKKGLAYTFLKGRRKIWAAENPERLLALFHEREMALQMALPQLHALRRTADAAPLIRTSAGIEEIKQIMHDLIATKHRIAAVLPWDEWVALLGQPFLDDFIALRKEHFLSLRLVTPKTPAAIALKARDSAERRRTEFLPAGTAIGNAIFIYGAKVALISIGAKTPAGILIEDRGIHRTMMLFFESVWLRSGGTPDADDGTIGTLDRAAP